MQREESIKRENSKKEKLKAKAHSGITLIALVITIIVLLILAGVALATLTGDSGILSNAEKAKENTAKANAKEQVAITVQGALIEAYAQGDGSITRNNLKSELDSIVGAEGKDYTLSEGEGPWTVKVGDYEATITQNGEVIGARDTETLPSAEGTTPWLPEGFTQVAGTTIDNGLTISNASGTQNYVWIEVPTTIEQAITLSDGTTKTVKLANAASDEEISLILEAYAGDYTKGKSTQDYSSWKEEWYDLYTATWDGVSEYAYIEYQNSNNFTAWRTYYGENNVYYSDSSSVTGTMTQVNFESDSHSSSNYYFVKVNDNFKNHSDGCGMTYSEYQTAYSNMLNSIKKYGGFWLAQYEAGIAYEEDGATATNRTSHSEITITKANYAKDQYVYNYVSCSEAQKIANADTTNEYTSTLPFGIQWDLVCKFLEVKTDLEYEDIATTSTWGNYYDTLYTPNSTARYYTSTNGKFNPVVAEDGTVYSKTVSGYVLLTTGALSKVTVDSTEYAASQMNIYDFAGNVYEWTLERATDYSNMPCASRGGHYLDSISDAPAAYRDSFSTTVGSSSYRNGFRSTLY